MHFTSIIKKTGYTFSRPVSRHARRSKVACLALTALAAGFAISLALPADVAHAADPVGADPANPAFGTNVIVFTPDMATADIQAQVDDIWNQQKSNEMGTQRYALLFEPGTYGTASDPLVIQVGYYTEVAGLGQDPSDVVINGQVSAFNPNGTGSLTVFWRSVSNLTIYPAGSTVKGTASDCAFSNTEAWAASQAAPMRRVDVEGPSTFMPYCDHNNYASGGYIADSVFNGSMVMGSQQQYYMRNSVLPVNNGLNGVWNQVFSGVTNAPATNFGNGGVFTTLPTTPISKEKPYLYLDDQGQYAVFVPSLAKDSSGVSWANGHTPGTSIPLSQFYLATPADTPATINAALAAGLNLLLTPGVYDLDSSINITRPDTIVLGLGLATLTATNGNAVITTADVGGIDIAGITVDAGEINSPVLVQIGSDSSVDLADDPVALQDVFFRIGGPHPGLATVALQVNSSDTILDHLWIWRADHGVAGSVGWETNRGDNGLVVNGDDVLAAGLFVEHFNQYNVIWNGNGGEVIFFQNELPYDAPNQAAYMNGDTPGYAAFKVADDVTSFTGYGMGAYVYTPVDPSIHVSDGFEVPITPGVRLNSIVTICLSGSGTIDHVVNGIGGTATQATVSQGQNVITYGAVQTTRTITYQGAGEATPAAVTQPVIWEDYVLGGAASVHTYVPQSDGYAAVTSPVIPGYDVDIAVVPAEGDLATTTTAPTNPDSVTVTYTAQTQNVNVVWVDDDAEGSPTVATTTLSGPTGSDVGFTADDAAAGAPAGYEVASIDNVATYDTDPATDQTITVHLTHHHTVTSLTTTRTITFTGASAAPAPVTQSMTWAVDTDDVTKAVTYTSQAGYPAVTVPAITGFSSSASTVAAGAVSSATLPTDSSVTVTYSGLPQSLRVTWVDDDADGEAVGTPVYLGGPSESEVGFTAADAAAGAPEGYDVASIDNVATYDTAQAVMQNIVVHLTHHHTIGSLTTTRTVQFTGVSGAPESVVQTQTWTVDTDEVTGDVVFSSEAGYAAVDVPAIEHATPSVTQVPATGAVAATDELPANTVYTVTYTAEQAPIVSAGPGGSGTGTGSGTGANAPTGGSVVGGNAGALGAMLLLAVAGCGVALVRRSVVRG